jgi:uncharacterized protein YraI
MKLLRMLSVLAAVLVAAPTISHAQLAYTAKDVNLRAGPAREYPVVAVLRGGVELFVEGCLADYRWCDVVAGPNRGWVYAGNIVYPYEGANVPLLTYGSRLGLGIVVFSVGSYWDNYYRGRPWYRERQNWIDRPRSGFGPGYRTSPQRPPAFRPGDHRPPQGPVVRPGDHRPPQGPVVRPGDHRPPQGPAVRPGGPRPPVQGPSAGQGDRRSPQGQGQGQGQGRAQGGQHAPQGQGSGGGRDPGGR